MTHTLLNDLDPDQLGHAPDTTSSMAYRTTEENNLGGRQMSTYTRACDFDEISIPGIQQPIADITRSFADLQLELIVQRYQARAGWMFYSDVQTGKRHQLVCHNTANAELDIAYQTYLESQDFLDDMTASAGLRALTLDDQSVIYAQCLHQGSVPHCDGISQMPHGSSTQAESASCTNQPHPDYLLIWQPAPLSVIAQQQLEQHILTIQQHLELEQTCQRQSTEIQLLEQVFQRIGHQLRHPLALLRLYTDNLCRLATTETTQAQAGQMKGFLQELGERLTHLIRYAQGGQLQLLACDLAAIWATSVQELQPLITEKQLRVDCSTTPIRLPIDAHQFRHVLDNVLHNAICFSPVGGQITCRWQLFQREALITVTDQGPGLSATDLEQMFRPFYTKREDGTGLGLAIAQKIVLDHQGSLWAENLPTGGTQISITLPRYVT
ncbi:MAG: sensor histidine kinase [Thainema sp.]